VAGLLTLGALILCDHGGAAEPLVSDSRVSVNGQPVIALASPFLVSGCPNPPPPVNTGPCVSGQYITSAERVTVSGLPVLLGTGVAFCVPTGTGLIVTVNQLRVTGQ
jgi:hypothetical protein